MMGFTFLTVLGFLGLLGILVLILIYVLKPNYQQKVISSTYVWKLSLKYRRRKVPISKWRNILLIICQFLIVILCAWILAQPVIKRMVEAETPPEGVIIIDTSASMMAQTDDVTRFDRALQYASDYIDQKYEENGIVTVIMAGEDSAKVVGGDELYRASLTTMTRRDLLRQEMFEETCSYGGCNPDDAISMAEVILDINPNAEILFITATEYSYVGCVQIVDIKEENREWNAAILSCEMSLDENDYLFSVEVACYDREQDVDLLIDVIGANNYDESVKENITNLRYTVRCEVDSEGKAISKLVEFKAEDCGHNGTISTFDYVYIRFDGVNDSLASDNEYYVYGGVKEEIRVQIWSKDPNSFFSISLFDLGSDLRETHDIFVTQVRSIDEPAREGFDIYLFEHAIPENVLRDGLPTDGVVFLCDPDTTGSISEAAGFTLGGELVVDNKDGKEVSAGVAHPITQYLRMEKIKLTKYRQILSYDSAIYQEVMTMDGNPIMLVRNEPNCKMFVMTFSVNYSTLTIEREFPFLIYNMLNYFIPLTMNKHVATVGEEMSFYGRSDELYVTGDGVNEVFTEFPNTVAFEKPGTYRFTQRLINGEERDELLYVRITPSESNIFKVAETLTDLGTEVDLEADTKDLLLYFAIALVAFLFVEWWLQSKEYFA